MFLICMSVQTGLDLCFLSLQIGYSDQCNSERLRRLPEFHPVPPSLPHFSSRLTFPEENTGTTHDRTKVSTENIFQAIAEKL